ncbi:hypothetical protein JHK82_026199 [Glycine max]|uniref:Uncharacterized protein n=2 Tax=Glycine subgen. Soja TaxID=1462606 RepID=A0A0R0IDF5_SOYBN|nr:hypothetical protein JHK87_026138 [Glycine soja]KAG5008269.1 hypothetical protein JHK85_026811 [Glycine max]KAG5014062.1 hypothetical protein JHK86_026323 [Glycine max]KAG5135011.1 hypothetical protein JHK82_026199 [Glycine max]KAH1044818.1 hypothetical protein GYH30_026186 [Glycine max]
MVLFSILIAVKGLGWFMVMAIAARLLMSEGWRVRKREGDDGGREGERVVIGVYVLFNLLRGMCLYREKKR